MVQFKPLKYKFYDVVTVGDFSLSLHRFMLCHLFLLQEPDINLLAKIIVPIFCLGKRFEDVWGNVFNDVC